MPTTTTLALPYPSPSDAVDVPGDIQALAEAVDTLIQPADGVQAVLGSQIFS